MVASAHCKSRSHGLLFSPSFRALPRIIRRCSLRAPCSASDSAVSGLPALSCWANRCARSIEERLWVRCRQVGLSAGLWPPCSMPCFSLCCPHRLRGAGCFLLESHRHFWFFSCEGTSKSHPFI